MTFKFLFLHKFGLPDGQANAAPHKGILLMNLYAGFCFDLDQARLYAPAKRAMIRYADKF
jgi:hypothetical protein